MTIHDRYNAITIEGEQDFVLHGQDLEVPLHFDTAGGFVLRNVLSHEDVFTTKDIIRGPSRYPVMRQKHSNRRYTDTTGHLTRTFAFVRDTFDVLGSRLIIAGSLQTPPTLSPGANLYRVNPEYTVTDNQE